MLNRENLIPSFDSAKCPTRTINLTDDALTISYEFPFTSLSIEVSPVDAVFCFIASVPCADYDLRVNLPFPVRASDARDVVNSLCIVSALLSESVNEADQYALSQFLSHHVRDRA